MNEIYLILMVDINNAVVKISTVEIPCLQIIVHIGIIIIQDHGGELARGVIPVIGKGAVIKIIFSTNGECAYILSAIGEHRIVSVDFCINAVYRCSRHILYDRIFYGKGWPR